MDHTTITLSLLITSLLVLFIASVMYAMKKAGGNIVKSAEKPAEPVFRVPSGKNEYRDLIGRTVRYRKSRKALRRGVAESGKAVLLGSRWRYRDGKPRLIAKLRNEAGTVFYRFNGFMVA